MLDHAIWSHVVTAHFAAPLMIETGPGLIVEITDGDSYGYRGNVFYDLVKTSVIRLAFAWSFELRRHRIASVALTPGFLRSEAMLDRLGVTVETWRDAAVEDANFAYSETPLFVGRAVAALASDPAVFDERNGRVFSSWQLSREYGFTDIDGSRPDWGAHAEATYGVYPTCDEGFYRYWRNGLLERVFPDWP
jgi:NAD(P)-dependent dehydrogenase (short-subunit alcohol dehydrogenase family)